MKYSILGFNQKLVCAITKEVQENDGKVKIYKLDMTDLIILKDIAEFMNRNNIIKYTMNDKIYFSITHKAILQDLPILDIKKQALKDRIDKLCLLGVIEKQVVRNDTGTWIGYRLTGVYESLLYSNDNDIGGVYQTTQGGCSKLHGGGVPNYNPNNNSTIKELTIKEEEKELKEKFAEFVALYKKLTGKRTRGIDTEFYEFKKKHKDWEQVIPYLSIAIERETKERNDCASKHKFFPEPQMLQTYLGKQRSWEKYVTIGEDLNSVTNVYAPSGNFSIFWHEKSNAYLYIGNYYDGMMIADGYNEDTRPNGATLVLNNARGTIKWNSTTKKWEKV